eukprot:evm.model.scf_1504.2 EVM.evm.TU.scf_1504.2   scf_1504:18876-20994(-)
MADKDCVDCSELMSAHSLVLQSQLPQSEEMTQETELRKLLTNITSMKLEDLQYHQNIMRFLHERVKKLEGCLLHAGQDSEVQFRQDTEHVARHLKLALNMLVKHLNFDISDFYKTDEAVHFVELTCRVIGDIECRRCSEDFRPIELPEAHVKEDKRSLEMLLHYILDEDSVLAGNELTTNLISKLETLKIAFSSRKKNLSMIPDGDIHLMDIITRATHHRGLVVTIHAAEWQGKPVAAKTLKADGAALGISDFAELYSEALNQAELDPKFVVKMHGITKSGTLVMERASCNLMQWYKSLPQNDSRHQVALKMSMLAQAAKALRSVHRSKMVHRDVKSENFLVFEDGEGSVVKIADFGLAIARDGLTSKTFRICGTARWMARELHEGQAPSVRSDVFSFGAVIYEVVTGKLPYGEGASMGDIYSAVLDGREPCYISPQVTRLWPEKVLRMMKRCCSHYPNKRPSMEEVSTIFDCPMTGHRR